MHIVCSSSSSYVSQQRKPHHMKKESLIERKNCTHIWWWLYSFTRLWPVVVCLLFHARVAHNSVLVRSSTTSSSCVWRMRRKKRATREEWWTELRRMMMMINFHDFTLSLASVYNSQTYDFYCVSRSLTLFLVSSCFLSINVDFAINNYRQCLSFVCRKFQCIENSMHLRAIESWKINFNW